MPSLNMMIRHTITSRLRCLSLHVHKHTDICVADPVLFSGPPHTRTGKEVVETLKVVDAETREAEAKKVVVLGEEAVANEKAASSKAIKVGAALRAAWLRGLGFRVLGLWGF